MRIVLSGVTGLTILFLGCTAGAPESRLQSEISTQAVPTTSGKFVGHYTVPTSSDLADAARFAVPEVEWKVSGGTATLRYDLPLGLVGGSLSVAFSGPIAAGATTVQLTGSGAGTCTASGTAIRCGEVFGDLGALPISETVVAEVAAAEYTGPVANRLAVATVFSSDPIGTVDFDITAPSGDGDGGGGGGGGRGPH